MRLEHYSSEQLKGEIVKIVHKHLNTETYRIFFFGSRVSGGGNERSDIDVGVEGPAQVPSREWLAIQEEIENLPTLYKIEIVDFKRVGKEFREVALQRTESLTSR
ncbi:MAG: nucleotidyltransferase domain-containing protein [Nanoarchaeota archaeon]|nr:nucleotidyltransferase domain-containing protein [Nanoarchaeota archaeon]